jgi:hypothetical protein
MKLAEQRIVPLGVPFNLNFPPPEDEYFLLNCTFLQITMLSGAGSNMIETVVHNPL